MYYSLQMTVMYSIKELYHYISGLTLSETKTFGIQQFILNSGSAGIFHNYVHKSVSLIKIVVFRNVGVMYFA